MDCQGYLPQNCFIETADFELDSVGPTRNLLEVGLHLRGVQDEEFGFADEGRGNLAWVREESLEQRSEGKSEGGHHAKGVPKNEAQRVGLRQQGHSRAHKAVGDNKLEQQEGRGDE